MSRYLLKTLLFLSIAVTAFAPLEAARSVDRFDEDAAIVHALLLEGQKRYPEATGYWMDLYRHTGSTEYLIRASEDALGSARIDPTLTLELAKALSVAKGSERTALARLLTRLYLKQEEWGDALKTAQEFLADSKEVEDLRLAATVAYKAGKPNRALELLRRAYRQSYDDRSALQIADLMITVLGQRPQAEEFLETHLRIHPSADATVALRLIRLYAADGRYDRILALYKRLYRSHPSPELMERIVKLSLFLHRIDELTDFLEKHRDGNEALLYRLYREQNRFEKSAKLARRLYRQTHDPKWLAEEAISLYEEARARHRITPKLLKRFQKLFDRALEEGADESLYLNYYGYTLIDHGLDLKRGIYLVRSALSTQPQNPYYLDSLAWGLYKQNKCRDALTVIKKAVRFGGGKVPEIRKHYRIISACVGAKKRD